MSPEMEHYHRGALSASVSMLSLPVMTAWSAANQTLFRAQQIEPNGEERNAILRQVERLEEAVQSLRKAADVGTQTLSLMAAE